MGCHEAEQFTAAQDGPSYLKKFGLDIMHKLGRLGAMIKDQFKSTFFANTSYKKQSPFLGILGSIEFLQETKINVEDIEPELYQKLILELRRYQDRLPTLNTIGSDVVPFSAEALSSDHSSATRFLSSVTVPLFVRICLLLPLLRNSPSSLSRM